MAAVGLGNPDARLRLGQVLAGSPSCMSKASPKGGGAFGLSRECYQGPAFGSGISRFMKITLGGRYTIAEFAGALAETLCALEDNGVEEVQGASLYLQTYSDRRQFFLLDASGRRIEHLDYDGAHART